MSAARQLKIAMPGIADIGETEVIVPKQSLMALGWRRVISTDYAESSSIVEMMCELQQGKFSHTWRWFDWTEPGDALVNLQEFENSRRKTKLCFYYGETSQGERIFMGAGAIAEKLSNSFPFDGFPVLSRCYVLEKFRGHRFYEPILQHRIEICRTGFGTGLKGIHLGTSNERVFAALRKRFFESEFTYLGNECLEGKHDIVVKAFLLFTPEFKASVQAALKSVPRCAAGRELQDLFKELFECQNNECFYYLVNQPLKTLSKKENWQAENYPALRELIAFMRALPLSEITSPAPKVELFPPIVSRKKIA